jgi:hypothetical protein
VVKPSNQALAAVIGVLSACVAIPDRNPSLAGGGGTSNAGGSSGATNGGNGGQSSAGSSGIDGSGGSVSQTGGVTSTGGSGGSASSGGSAGSSGSVGEGGAAGGAGSPNCKTIVVAQAGTAEDAMIDDFEDGNSSILANDGRQGSWFLTTDNSGTVTPASGMVTPGADDGTVDGYGIKVTGSNVTVWGVDLSATFVPATDGCYDASAYTGIRVIGAGNTDPANKTYGAVHLAVLTAGVRAAPLDQRNFHKVVMDVDYGGAFVIYDFPWAEFTQIGGWGTQVPFDPSEIFGVAVYAEGPDIEFAIDDVQFLTE